MKRRAFGALIAAPCGAVAHGQPNGHGVAHRPYRLVDALNAAVIGKRAPVPRTSAPRLGPPNPDLWRSLR